MHFVDIKETQSIIKKTQKAHMQSHYPLLKN